MKMYRSYWTAALLALWTAIPSLVHSQPEDTPVFRPITDDWQWVNDDWKNDDSQYAQIRTQVDGEVSKRQLSAQQIERDRLIFEQNRTDPVGLFRWAYESFKVTHQHSLMQQVPSVGPGAFEYARSPNVYDYDRLRFLVWAIGHRSQELQSLGERLLQKVPDDTVVEYYLIGCYEPWKSDTEKAKALALAENVISKEPNHPNPYSVLACVYFDSWFVHRDKSDADNAVTAYNTYLRLAAADDSWKIHAEKAIQYIQSHPSKD